MPYAVKKCDIIFTGLEHVLFSRDDRLWGSDRVKSLQHCVFPGGHPSKY